MQWYLGWAFALASGIDNVDKEELRCGSVVLWQIMHLAQVELGLYATITLTADWCAWKGGH